jgi:hypothetical protein
MSKKTLLEEGTVRQFMKLANLKPLASSFINETYVGDPMLEQEEEDEMLPPEPDDAAMDMVADEEAPIDDIDDMDMGAEEGAEGALAGVSEDAVKEIVDVVTTALEAATGVTIDVTGGEEGEEAIAMAPEGEEVVDDDFAPADELEGDEDEDPDKLGLAEINMIDEDAVMQETYRRVAKRLGAMNKQHKLVESVTNRIMGRLAKSK